MRRSPADPPPSGGAAALPDPRAAGMTLSRYALLVGAGAFATTFAQLRILAQYPITFLLKDQFHMQKEQVAVFFFWATFAWSVKPLAGIFTDAFPLFGTRRRHYMMIGAALAGVCWLLMGASAGNYRMLFAFAIALNVFTVFASTVMGGLMVEAGQAFGAPGRIASLRQFVQSVAQILAPLLGGYLATVAFGWTAGIAATTVLALAGLTFFTLHEPPLERRAAVTERPHYRLSPTLMAGIAVMVAGASLLFSIPDTRNIGVSLFSLLGVFLLILGLVFMPTTNPVIVRAQGQLIAILQSRSLWLAAAMVFLIYTVPGFNTALVYQQSDVLHFDKKYIGFLSALEAAFGVLAALAYAFFCRKINLRVLLLVGVALNGLTTLFYMIYTQPTAPLAHVFNGFCLILAEMAVMDLSVRATPRGCEALGFSLMMSMRNFGIALSDVIGSKLMDQFHFTFNSLIVANVATTLAILLFLPLIPKAILSWKDGGAPA